MIATVTISLDRFKELEEMEEVVKADKMIEYSTFVDGFSMKPHVSSCITTKEKAMNKLITIHNREIEEMEDKATKSKQEGAESENLRICLFLKELSKREKKEFTKANYTLICSLLKPDRYSENSLKRPIYNYDEKITRRPL